MTDLKITDANATNTTGGCGCGGCGCGGQAEATQPAAAQGQCACGTDCGCGCQDGKPCTCGEARPEAKGTSDAPAGATVAQYTVSGMTCGHCVNAITEEVSALDGVTDVAVDLESGSLKVTSQAPIDFDRIVEAVSEAGDYTVA